MAIQDGETKHRYFPRIEAEVLVAYRPLSSPEEEPMVTKTKTLGLGGLMIESEHSLPLGTVYHLELVLQDHRVAVQGKVVYSNPVATHVYHSGFGFVSLTDAQSEQLTASFLKEYDKSPREGKSG